MTDRTPDAVRREIELRFTSGNAVPVERAMIRAKEWRVLEEERREMLAEIERLKAVAWEADFDRDRAEAEVRWMREDCKELEEALSVAREALEVAAHALFEGRDLAQSELNKCARKCESALLRIDELKGVAAKGAHSDTARDNSAESSRQDGPVVPDGTLPLMARREWMPHEAKFGAWTSSGAFVCYRSRPQCDWYLWIGDDIETGANELDGRWSGDHRQSLHRITDTDKFGMPVVPRPEGAPADARYFDPETQEYAGDYDPEWTARCRISWQRLEDYVEP